MSNGVMSSEYPDDSQRMAICSSQWRGRNVDVNTKLLELVKSRRQKQKKEPFSYGVLTADVYVRTLMECVGLDCCNKFVGNGQATFNDLLKNSHRTLVYSNPEMVIEEKQSNGSLQLPDGVELPKNTLMAFRHVLSTPRKDRDGDILRSEGAVVDPKMLLLWQHVHTLPIGKMLAIAEQNEKRLVLYSAIVDMNELCHDAAVMADNDMARFSHGFRALKFDDIKGDQSDSPSGFDVKEWEAMEESMVSVPSNVDANTEEVLISLVERGKMTSNLMREYSRSLLEKRPKQVPGVEIRFSERLGEYDRELVCSSFAELKQAHDAGLIGIGDEENENKSGSRSNETKGKREEQNSSSSSKETNELSVQGEKDGQASNSQVKRMALTGSWECIERRLRAEAKRYLAMMGIRISERDMVWIAGTFSNHVIVCVEKCESGVSDEYRYFRLNWTMDGDEPSFSGEPEQVELVTTTEIIERSPLYDTKCLNGEKRGRVISKANEGKIREAIEDVNEAAGLDVSRACKSLLRSASSNLTQVLESLGAVEPEESEQRETSVIEAMGVVLSEASAEQRETMKASLQALADGEKRSSLTKQYLACVGKKQ